MIVALAGERLARRQFLALAGTAAATLVAPRCALTMAELASHLCG